MKQMIQEQGDVVLIPISKLPTGVKKMKGNVVQEGEHTGHAHRLQMGTSQLYEDDNKTRFLAVSGGSDVLTHEEHAAQIIEEGLYEVRIVRQKDPFTKLVSKVLD